jgi:heme/copper-type cytochrome/quinol oxidase subunit 2
MERRNAFIVLVLLVVLGLVIWVILAQKNSGNSWFGSSNSNTSSQPKTYEQLSGPVSIPNKGGTAPANVAVPSIQTSAGNNTSAQFRSFDISLNGSSWSPNNIIVKIGDTVHLNISSSGNYDFTQPDYGIKKQLLPRTSNVLEFQVTATGKFTFYCVACGGPSSGPIGYLIVSP